MQINRYALIDGDLVVNIVLWDGASEWTPPAGLVAVACADEVGPGWTRSEGEWIAPAEPEAPEEGEE